MSDNTSDYFIRDVEDDQDDDDLLSAPVIVPIRPAGQPAPQQPTQQQQAAAPAAQAPQASQAAPQHQPGPAVQQPSPAAPKAVVRESSREERLAETLNTLMATSSDIQAAALVSLDGFTIASALPEGMQEDRVGAMSAAILGLGERAAVELGRGKLSQVFIEGDEGFVLLMAAGDRAVLTALADKETKLGLVLYDMRATAETIGKILG